MAIALQVEPDFRLGNLSISPRACLVSSDRGARRLQPRVMQVLVALARASGDVVTREQLIDLAWNGAVVSEDAITRTIGHIRRLSEWGEGYAFRVQTVPTIGYSLTPIEQPEIKPRSEPLLAVLPFDNISDDPALRYVSEGLSEEILQTIARGTSIRVIGRASSFQFRGGKKAAGEIARELQATHMLDGAVRRRGDRLRVTAHLMETATQTMVWSDRFDFARSETFDVQERIAELVAAALSRTFARSLRPADIDPDAYDLYLRGAELCRDIVPESQHQAIVLLEEATERAPEFADAWGELALARAQAGYLRFERRVGDARAERARIEADAARARSLDPDCPSARLIPFVGGPAFDFAEHRRQFEGPRRSRLATTASPDVSTGVQLLEVGRTAEALEHFRQAEMFDPLFQIMIFFHCHALVAVGALDDAVAKLDNAIERWPGIPFFTATRILWAALAEDWLIVDALLHPKRLALFPLRHRHAEVLAMINSCRGGDTSPAGFARLRDLAFGLGKTGLEPILLYARRVGLAKTLGLATQHGRPLVDIYAPRRPDDLGAISLFLPFFADVRRDPMFPVLCARLGLVAHWRTTGRWPTCADEFAPGVFQSGCETALIELGPQRAIFSA